ncbi:MAG: hypothetical protein O7C61_12680, partial [SAR324 cluster bacterium]|nr:hypothetical protein [SAR324 cluster bacterium]
MEFALSHYTSKESWLRYFTYSLFAFSLISITGVELSVTGLFLLAIYARIQDRYSARIPLRIVAPFAAWILVAFLSSLANPDWLGNLFTLRHQYRIFLPLALLVSLNNVNLRRLL